jgi:hypothetical protein
VANINLPGMQMATVQPCKIYTFLKKKYRLLGKNQVEE